MPPTSPTLDCQMGVKVYVLYADSHYYDHPIIADGIYIQCLGSRCVSLYSSRTISILMSWMKSLFLVHYINQQAAPTKIQ